MFTRINMTSTLLVSVLCLSAAPVASAQSDVSFGRDVRPILSNNCFFCHGPDEAERKADLRLDTREGLFADLGGDHAIVSGDADQSELFQRMITEEEDDRMLFVFIRYLEVALLGRVFARSPKMIEKRKSLCESQ
ncbi:MAG: c-type cytochrome domain-containing protein [Pirellulaceae bacterium]